MKRTIVIVGGVAGGASAATRARRLNEDARIIIIEKDDTVSYANCGMPYFIGGEIQNRANLAVATPKLLWDRFRIETWLEHEVQGIDPANHMVSGMALRKGEPFTISYDKLILATGAAPILPDLPGVNTGNVFTLRNLVDMDGIHHTTQNAKKAVIVGAGFIGLEMAEQLRRRGIEVSLVQLTAHVLSPLLDADLASHLADEITRHGVKLHLGTTVAKIHADAGKVQSVTLSDGSAIEADLVLFAIGVRPNVALAQKAGLKLGPSGGVQINEFAQTSDPDIYAVGDMVEYQHKILGRPARVPLAGPANRSGRTAGEHAATDHANPLRPVYGSAIVRVFDQTAAVTGLGLDAARREGLDAEAVVRLAHQHPAYYPGEEHFLFRLVYDRKSGRILGAQLVGKAGVETRVNIVATAINFGGTVDDLAGLDLAYSPQYGSAKDSIHIAAFMAQNARDRLVKFASLDASEKSEQLLDVRTDAEWDEKHNARSRHIPLHLLRDRLGELDRDRPTIIICRSGQRAYIASRILDQRGFKKVSVQAGGMVI